MGKVSEVRAHYSTAFSIGINIFLFDKLKAGIAGRGNAFKIFNFTCSSLISAPPPSRQSQRWSYLPSKILILFETIKLKMRRIQKILERYVLPPPHEKIYNLIGTDLISFEVIQKQMSLGGAPFPSLCP